MKTVLNVKTDTEVKEKAQELAGRLGVPLSTIVNAYLKEFIRAREVHLMIEPRPRAEVAKLLHEASRDRLKRKNSSKRFSTNEEMLAYLHA